MLTRAVSLELTVMVRSLGLWPWLGLFAACTAARVQEPVFLRSQRIELTWEAIPIFTCMLSLAFTLSLAESRRFSAERICGSTAPFLALFVLTVTTCVVATLTGVLLDVVFGTQARWPTLINALTYPVTRLAPTLALAVGVMRTRLPLQAQAAVLLGSSAVVVLLLGGEDPVGGPSARTLAVSALATTGSLGVTAFLCDTRRLP